MADREAGDRPEVPGRPATAVALGRWRTQAGLSRQRLADLADVSATYVRTIEAGADDLGRAVVPSAAIMQKLAHGLAQALAAVPYRRQQAEGEVYADLMAAAGLLPPAPARPPAARPGAAAAESRHPAARHRVAESAEQLPHAPQRRYGGPVQMHPLMAPDLDALPATAPATVTLRDPRLQEHARDLLENWEALDRDDQALLLGIMAWVHERRRTTHERPSGGL
ncbi:MAG: helix-turn-helix transcriptional regulator [Anaerolineae bacterium]